MAFINKTLNSQIFKEFKEDKQKEYFSLSQSKVIHNIDTFYFNLYFDEEKHFHIIDNVVNTLNRYKELAKNYRELQNFLDLQVFPYGIKMYSIRIGKENMYDIFVCPTLPNKKTPRVHVQCRSIGLWLESPEDLIFEVVEKVENIFKIPVIDVVENRIDYAFHTNSIQNPSTLLSDNNIRKSLKSSLKIYQKIGERGREITIDYFSLGSRGSDLFFRLYNKTREVLEENYKGFFIKIWYDNKLISLYDKFCLEYAYKQGSYNAMHLGRILWYLEFGTDEFLKNELFSLFQKCSVNSDNFDFLISKLDGVLPPVTLIINVEFETKRGYYSNYPFSNFLKTHHKPFTRIFQLLENKKTFIKRLTNDTVKFCKSETDIAYWWRRIQLCKVKNSFDASDVLRVYFTNLDKEKIHKTIAKNVATYSIFNSDFNIDEDIDYSEDVLSLISNINDNDIKKGYYRYNLIKEKRYKQLKPLLNNK